MAEGELLLLMRNTLIPYASNKAKDLEEGDLKGGVLRMTNPSARMSLEDLSSLESMLQSSVELPDDAKSQLLHLLGAWYLVNSGHTTNYTKEIFQKSNQYLGLLRQRGDIDLKQITDEMVQHTVFGLLQSTNFNDIRWWLNHIARFKEDSIEDIENPVKTAYIQIQTIAWNHLKADDFPKLIQVLDFLRDVKNTRLGIELDEIENILGELMINYAHVNIENPDELRDGVNKMKLYEFKSERIAQETDRLVSQLQAFGLQHETQVNLSDDFSGTHGEAIYDHSSLFGLGNVHNWNELTRTSETPLHLAQRGPVKVTVWKAKINESKLDVAVKVYSARDAQSFNIYHKEIEYLERLSKTNQKFFLKFYGAFMDVFEEEGTEWSRLNIVMEYCPNTLINEIDKRKNQNRDFYSEIDLLDAMDQLIDGFVFLEGQRIFHQDIKPHNIFIQWEGPRALYKIADFNVSKTADPSRTTFGTTMTHAIQGTDGYFSPELQNAWNNHKRSNGPRTTKYVPNKSDVYSLGLTFFQMATLETILGLNSSERQTDLEHKISQLSYSDNIKNLLRAMLKFDPRERPIFIQLKQLMPAAQTV